MPYVQRISVATEVLKESFWILLSIQHIAKVKSRRDILFYWIQFQQPPLLTDSQEAEG